MRQRQDRQEGVVLVNRLQDADHRQFAAKVFVRQHDPFGPGSRSGGIDDGGEVFLFRIPDRSARSVRMGGYDPEVHRADYDL